jgi:hypothetical protein
MQAIGNKINETSNSYSPRPLPSLTTIAKVAVCILAAIPVAGNSTLSGQERREISYPPARMCATHEIPSANGKGSCRINNDIISFSECDQLVTSLGRQLRKEMPDLAKSLAARINPSTGLDFDLEAGYMFEYGGSRITLSINPERFSNCEKAYDFIQDEVLNEDSFFRKNGEEEILKTISASHRVIASHMPSELSPGEFRSANLVVMDEEVARSYEGMYGELKKRGGTSKELKKFRTVFQKIALGTKLTPKESAILKKLSPASVDYREIETEMRAFARNLKEKMEPIEQGISTQDNVIETASWAHQELVRIHPFADANGRVARLWLNTVLEKGGIPSILFPIEERYLSKTDADLRGNTGVFTEYLKKTIKSNRKIQAKLSGQEVYT